MSVCGTVSACVCISTHKHAYVCAFKCMINKHFQSFQATLQLSFGGHLPHGLQTTLDQLSRTQHKGREEGSHSP